METVRLPQLGASICGNNDDLASFARSVDEQASVSSITSFRLLIAACKAAARRRVSISGHGNESGIATARVCGTTPYNTK